MERLGEYEVDIVQRRRQGLRRHAIMGAPRQVHRLVVASTAMGCHRERASGITKILVIGSEVK